MPTSRRPKSDLEKRAAALVRLLRKQAAVEDANIAYVEQLIKVSVDSRRRGELQRILDGLYASRSIMGRKN